MFGRFHTSQALTVDNNTYLIDCGEGTQNRIAEFGIKRDKIRAICISHLHGDHYLGLMGVLSTMHLLGRKRPLVLIGPKGLREILTLQLKYSGTIFQYPVTYTEVNEPGAIYEDKKISIEAFLLEHRIPCFGYKLMEKPKPLRINKKKLSPEIRVQDIGQLKAGNDVLHSDGTVKYKSKNFTLPPKKSRSFAFCSDTRFTESIVPAIRNVDLLYHESTFVEDDATKADKTYHSTAHQAATIASMAKAGRLIIGHFSARYKSTDLFLEEAQRVFPATQLAVEGEKYCVEE